MPTIRSNNQIHPCSSDQTKHNVSNRKLTPSEPAQKHAVLLYVKRRQTVNSLDLSALTARTKLNETCTEEMTSASGHAESDNGAFTDLTQCPGPAAAWQLASGTRLSVLRWHADTQCLPPAVVNKASVCVGPS